MNPLAAMNFEDMVGTFAVLVFFIIPWLIFVITWWISWEVEKSHYRSIQAREQQFARLPVVPTPTADPTRRIVDSRLVSGSVVLSSGPFRRFMARLRMLIGGRVRGYEILLDRARREAILRMKAACPEADIILNLRLETSMIVRNESQKGMAAVEVVASGTAIRYAA